ncbi:MAG: FAD-linked oxidase C-terminal domain-containing protein [Acidobacteriota bacterium]
MATVLPSAADRAPGLEGSLIQRLESILGPDGVRAGEEAADKYGRDETEDFHFPPALAVLPRSTAEVSQVLALAHRERLPVTPRGAGTGLSGGALPVEGGIVLSVERMNRILSIDERDLVVEAQSGVVTGDLQRAVSRHGLYYPPDPSSRDTCLLAGNLAENAAGARSCKYGPTGRWVLGLEAVMADGRVIETGGRNRKDVSGYDLTHLLIGSEGTLAVITRATLRLIGQPSQRLALLLPFPDLEPAAAAVEAIFRGGHQPAACELIEEKALGAVARLEPLPQQLEGHRALLLLELDGHHEDALLEEAARLSELSESVGGGEALLALDRADQERLWKIRRRMGEAVKHLSSYKEADTVVPRSRLAELVQAARAAGREQELEVVCYGHAGDGNLHVNILRGDLDEASWRRRRDACERALFERVLELGGSLTGEHGIGWVQRSLMPLRHDPASLEIMRGIKRQWDPRGILNPSKIFPDQDLPQADSRA